MKKKIKGKCPKKISGRTMSEFFSGRIMSEIFSGSTMSENFSGRTMSEKCFGEDNVRNLFGEDNVHKMVQGVQCPKILGRTMSENIRGDNVQREVMSICFRESNTNNRSGNSKTRGANG